MRARGALVAVVSALIAATTVLGTVVAAMSPTQAAWTDRVGTTASVAAGSWKAAEPTPATTGCTALGTDGKPVAGGTCAITSVSMNQWSDSVNVVRDYYITAAMGQGGVTPSVAVDLAKYGSGSWTWGAAVTIATGQYTLAAPASCGDLPILRATGPTGWGPTTTFWVRVTQAKPAGLSAPTCS